jgi:hypothetical protein
MNDPQLMQLLKFDEAELQANRLGRISEKQRARLAQEESSRKSCSSVMGIFLLIIALVGVGAAVAYGYAMYRFSIAGVIGFGAGFGCIWPLVWGGLGISSLRRSFVKLVIQVKKAEGPVNIVKAVRESYNSSSHTTSHYTVYELHVGGRSFDVSAELPNLMMQGDVYAVYFADNNQQEAPEILSVDLLSSAKSDLLAAVLSAVGATTAPDAAADAKEFADALVDAIETEKTIVASGAILDDAQVVEFLKKGNLLKAIQAYRAIHNSSFEEARAAVLEMQSRLGFN